MVAARTFLMAGILAAATLMGPAGAQVPVASPFLIINQERIQKSTARSIADLLAENAVGFMSEFTPGQTSINIRGAATDGHRPARQAQGGRAPVGPAVHDGREQRHGEDAQGPQQACSGQ